MSCRSDPLKVLDPAVQVQTRPVSSPDPDRGGKYVSSGDCDGGGDVLGGGGDDDGGGINIGV